MSLNTCPMKKTIMFLFLIEMLFCLFGCSSNQSNSSKRDEVLITIDEHKYDSVLYYKDVNWVSYKGIEEIAKSELNYPFTVFCYRGGVVEMQIFFNEKKMIKRYKKKYKGYDYVQSKYYSIENRDTVYGVYLVVSDSLGLSFWRKNPLEQDSVISFKGFNINIMNSLRELKILHYDFGFKNEMFYLDNILEAIENSTPIVEYASFSENVLELISGDVYHIYDYIDDRYLNNKRSNNKKYLQTKNIIGSSFFYYYNDIESFASGI